MSEQALQQAQAEGLALAVAVNKTGYFAVHLNQRTRTNPYEVQVSRGGKRVHMGSFATAEEAALCVARLPEGRAAAQKAPAAVPLTSEEALQQAQAEGLTLRAAKNTAGYFGVSHRKGKRKPYQVQVARGGKDVQLGCFVTAEEAALCVARSSAPPPLVIEENAGRAGVQPHATSDDGGGDDASEEGEEDFEVLDAIEVLDAWTDDDDDTSSWG